MGFEALDIEPNLICIDQSGQRIRHEGSDRRMRDHCVVMQVDRMDTIAAVHEFRVRVVVATDVAARGVDLSAVNLVSLSPPADNALPTSRN